MYRAVSAIMALYRTSTRSSARKIHYYRRLGAAGAEKATSHGMCSTRSKLEFRLCDRSCSSLTGRYSPSLCCEPPLEKRSMGNLHAAICGSQRRVTASGDPVGGVARLPLSGSIGVALQYLLEVGPRNLAMHPPQTPLTRASEGTSKFDAVGRAHEVALSPSMKRYLLPLITAA
jgi:hypothetical protein